MNVSTASHSGVDDEGESSTTAYASTREEAHTDDDDIK
jgi:hypothetical protein